MIRTVSSLLLITTLTIFAISQFQTGYSQIDSIEKKFQFNAYLGTLEFSENLNGMRCDVIPHPMVKTGLSINMGEFEDNFFIILGKSNVSSFDYLQIELPDNHGVEHRKSYIIDFKKQNEIVHGGLYQDYPQLAIYLETDMEANPIDEQNYKRFLVGESLNVSYGTETYGPGQYDLHAILFQSDKSDWLSKEVCAISVNWPILVDDDGNTTFEDPIAKIGRIYEIKTSFETKNGVKKIGFADNIHPESETNEQTSLSGDLLNSPLALDILDKIEQTKKWIADLEKREYEKTKAQQELDEKRAIALERLNQDLLEWENLWANYTSRAAFERFVEDKPPAIQGVFWDQFEFKEMKVNAGRAALKEVIASGGTLSEARAAYHKAAETKRIELIEMNAQFNVKHNLAYYKQQLLFNSTGQLPLNPLNQATLGEYYKDYRTNPGYLQANPNDNYAYESLETTADTNCRSGYVVVQRLPNNDYACITESTAEMWERHGIGKIVDTEAVVYDEASLTPTIPTNPGTQCKERHIVVYHFEAEAYGCVLESVAKTWIEDNVAEIHDLTEFILEKDKQKEIDYEVYSINMEIDQIYDQLVLDQLELKAEYDQMYKNSDKLAKQNEKELQKKYYDVGDMTKEELSIAIMKIRENNDKNKEQILEDKSEALDALNLLLHKKLQKMTSEFDSNPEIKIIWDSDTEKFHAEQR